MVVLNSDKMQLKLFVIIEFRMFYMKSAERRYIDNLQSILIDECNNILKYIFKLQLKLKLIDEVDEVDEFRLIIFVFIFQ